MGVGAISSKTVVCILSVLFLAAAIGMWFIGGYVISTYKQISTLASAYYTLVPAVVIIFVGIVFVLGAVAGFIAVFRESKVSSLLFFVFVFLLFALLITAIVLSAVYKNEINEIVADESKRAMDKYDQPNQEATTKQIDYLQKQFKCCGTYNFTSWDKTLFGKNNTDHVPLSCCKDQANTTVTCKDGNLDKMGSEFDKYIHTAGCVKEVDSFLSKNLHYLGAGAIAFLIILLLGMIGSCIVLWNRKEANYFNLGS